MSPEHCRRAGGRRSASLFPIGGSVKMRPVKTQNREKACVPSADLFRCFLLKPERMESATQTKGSLHRQKCFVPGILVFLGSMFRLLLSCVVRAGGTRAGGMPAEEPQRDFTNQTRVPCCTYETTCYSPAPQADQASGTAILKAGCVLFQPSDPGHPLHLRLLPDLVASSGCG